jgi:hypothetical protein
MPDARSFCSITILLASSFQIGWRRFMLEDEFKRQRAKVVRELAEQTTDPFIKRRLLALVSRYDDGVATRAPLTSVDLEFKSHRTGSER